MLAIGAGAVAAALAVVTWKFGGMIAIGLVAVGVVAVLLLNNAGAAVLVSAIAFIGIESEPEWGVPALARLYDGVPGGFSPVELTMVLAAAAVMLDVVRRKDARLPTGFVASLSLAAAAVVFAILNGYLGGDSQAFAQQTFLKSVAPLFVFPLLIVNVVHSREELRKALGVAGLLAVYKALTGLGVAFLGLSALNSDGGPQLTYYAPAANWLLLLSLLTAIGAWLAGVPLPKWVKWTIPLVALCLLLSYRRTFWLAFVLCLLILIPLATGRAGRRLMLPAALLVALSGWLILSAGFAAELQGPLVQRAKSIDPTKVSRNNQDRYRLAERRNVLEEIRRQPLTGIGAGVNWTGRYPLNFEYPFGRDYVHLSGLWWWLKGGLLGLAAYLFLLLSVVVCAITIWRRHKDPLIAVAALAAGVGTIGLLTVELASSVIGPDQRGTAAFGIVIGLLAVARQQLYAQEIPATEAKLAE